MDSELRRAIDNARAGLSQDDYNVLIKWCSVSGSDGRAATDALKYAIDNNNIRNVSRRDTYAEDRYLR